MATRGSLIGISLVLVLVAGCRSGCRGLERSTPTETAGVMSQGGSLHRVSAARCSLGRPAEVCEGKEPERQCTRNADCRNGRHGVCAHTKMLPIGDTCACDYRCETDDDCGPHRACLCGAGPGAVGRCVEALCRVDSDCPSAECGLSNRGGFCLGDTLACRSAGDACRSSADCPTSQNGAHDECVWDAGRWTCRVIDCVP